MQSDQPTSAGSKHLLPELPTDLLFAAGNGRRGDQIPAHQFSLPGERLPFSVRATAVISHHVQFWEHHHQLATVASNLKDVTRHEDGLPNEDDLSKGLSAKRIYLRYRRAGKDEKRYILDELRANCGYHSKYGIRLLNVVRRQKPSPSGDAG